jgi:hypothetical protein
MKESLYNQFLEIADKSNPLHKETYMFTPEIMHFCRWLNKRGSIADLARLERGHLYDYYRYVDTKSETAQSPHYANAHRFGAQLVCTLLYFNKVTADNFAAPSPRRYGSPSRGRIYA